MKMSVKELLAKILNKILKMKPAFGSWTGISNGFVAPADGFIWMRVTSAGGSNWFYTNVGRLSMQGGLSQDGVFPITAGTTFVVEAWNASNYCYAWYMPLVMGGVVHSILNALKSLSFKGVMA